jgi:hypothetical protein
MRPLKCFIATSLGQKDVDGIFNKALKRVLRKLNIEPYRVDDIEHNEDIDNKIIELISQCDFCIADLTYSRPSVYYEAGFVHGLDKPVIFTARTDHFKPDSKDAHGNFRIHFDLQMKNIIGWKEPTDYFRSRLSSRIQHVTQPIIKKLEADEKKKREEESFSRLSQEEKSRRINEIARNSLKKNKFKDIKTWAARTISVKNTKEGYVLAVVLVDSSFTKQMLLGLRWGSSWIGVSNYLDKKVIDRRKIIEVIFLCCSFRSVPINRIADALPDFSAASQQKIYYKFPKEDSRVFNDCIFLHVIDNFKCEKDFELQLSKHIPLIK